MARLTRIALLLMVVPLLLAACQPLIAVQLAGVPPTPVKVPVTVASPTPIPTPTAAPAPDAPLLTLRAEGGFCMYGSGCTSVLVLRHDGSYTLVHGDGTTLTGRIAAEAVAGLEAAIAQADFAEIRSRPFADTCPIAYDGQEWIYTFHMAAGDEVIASCEVAIDQAAAPFREVEAITAEIWR
jgi:hypothetical protein